MTLASSIVTELLYCAVLAKRFVPKNTVIALVVMLCLRIFLPARVRYEASASFSSLIDSTKQPNEREQAIDFFGCGVSSKGRQAVPFNSSTILRAGYGQKLSRPSAVESLELKSVLNSDGFELSHRVVADAPDITDRHFHDWYFAGC